MKREDLLLESASGFMMPFAAGDDEQVQVTLGFGDRFILPPVRSSTIVVWILRLIMCPCLHWPLA